VNMRERRRVLAIGIDAAEPTLVRSLIARGKLPTLARLLDGGTWHRVLSPAHIGSGAVWPTFLTGTDPAAHGVYGEWAWQPGTMDVARYSNRALTPFWAALAGRGITVGVLDVPFAPPVALTTGFAIGEWGAHDVIGEEMTVAPAAHRDGALRRIGPHPFARTRPDAAGSVDPRGLAALAVDCRDGLRLRGRLAARLLAETRPDLAIVVFPELHTAEHYLWHTIAPDHPFYAGIAPTTLPAGTPGLEELFAEADQQIAHLLEIVGDDAAVVVFSLHGMEPTRGVPAFLDPLLRGTGFAHRADWAAQSWPTRARSAFGAAKRRAPRPLKALYYRALPGETTRRLARPTMLPAHDWATTRAFALPTDQHGWIRLNLIGREAAGIVAPEDYDATCRQLADLLLATRTRDGRPVARTVIPLAQEAGGPPMALPDLVVHWHDAAFDLPLHLAAPPLEAAPVNLKRTGHHAPDGFCIARSLPTPLPPDAPLAARDLYRLLTGALDPD
jgi:predicted AlkP superfamily phosphohydrolase/phosphomutase